MFVVEHCECASRASVTASVLFFGYQDGRRGQRDDIRGLGARVSLDLS